MIYTSLDIISANTPNNISHFRTANPTIEIYQLLLSPSNGISSTHSESIFI